MPGYYAPLPSYQPGNALQFGPVNNALAQVTAQNNANRQLGIEQQASNRADQQLDLQKQTTAAGLRNSGLEYEKNLAGFVAGPAQAALELKDPNAQTAIWNGIKNAHPDFAKNLVAHGIDPNDTVGGLNFVVNEAKGYQNPLDVAAKKAQIAGLNATVGLNEQKMKLAKRQFDFTSSLINGANGHPTAAAPAAPNVGDVDSGYRFKGGNPADPNSWEPAQ
jgi:hypothetical protein